MIENNRFVANLDNEELKSIEGGKNAVEYFVMGAGYALEWLIDHGEILDAPRPYGMY